MLLTLSGSPADQEGFSHFLLSRLLSKPNCWSKGPFGERSLNYLQLCARAVHLDPSPPAALFLK